MAEKIKYDDDPVYCPLLKREIAEVECIEANAQANGEYGGYILEDFKKIEDFANKCKNCEVMA